MGELTRAERNIRWIEEYCRVPEGSGVGKPMNLREWQKDNLRAIYDNEAGTRLAILSFGRKNGKTALAACLCLLHLCGPEARRNSQLYSAAQSRDQASILFRLASKMVRMSPLGDWVHIKDSAKTLVCADLGTEYRALSADASTAYGLSPVFIVHDELGQVRGPRSELYEALETATGAQDDPLSVVISTQAPNPTDLLSVLIDDARAGGDPRVTLSLYETPKGDDPFTEASIRKANPAFGDFQNARETLAMAEDARRMPSREAGFRNLILNQRVEMNAPFISRSVWEGCMGEVEEFGEAPVFGGLDLSAVSDLTALVYVAAIGGKWHVSPRFWLPGDGLAERSRADRVPYDQWAVEGLIEAAPGKAIDYEYVAGQLFADSRRLNIQKIAFDRWNWRHFRPWLEKAGFSERQLDGDHALFEPFGQGFQSMSPAMRALESAVLAADLVHDGHPVLTMCMGNAIVTSDPAGNRKMDKAKTTGRIDGAVSLAMAMGVAGTLKKRAPSYLENEGAELIVL